MRGLHFARAAILTQVAGFGKNVVSLFWFLMRQHLLLIGSSLMHGLRKNRGFWRGRKFGGVMFHKSIMLGDGRLFVAKILLRCTAETEAIIRLQPVERRGFIGVQPKPMATLNKMIALLRIFHRAAGFLIIRPILDLRCRLFRAVGQQPGADFVIIFRDFYGGGELVAGDALEAEELLVQRTIVVIFAERARQAGAAFIHRPAGDGKSTDTFARTVRGLLG